MAKRKTSEKRKEEIFEATVKIISEEGKENLTIRRIADRVDVSEAAIYRHFDNKKDILLQLARKIFTQQSLNLKEIDFNEPFQSLKSIIDSIFSNLEEDPYLTSFLFHEELFAEYPKLREMLWKNREKKMKKIKELIENAQEENKISEDVDPKTFAEIFTGAIQISVLKWKSSDFSYSLQNESKKLAAELSKILEKNSP